MSRIHGSLEDAGLELERYDEEIERVRGTLERLQQERERLQREVDGNRGLLSPVRRLPSELLQSIFTFLSESECYSLAISHSGTVVHSPIFNVSRTSTFWRRIVYSIPELWRSISVDIIGLDSKRRLLHLVNAYLQNSGQSPLIVQITDDDFSPEDDHYFDSIGNTGLDVFKTLVSHSERWTKVDLRFRQDIFRMALETGSFHLPRLEELTLQSLQLTTSIRAACSKTLTLRTLKVDNFTYYGIAFPYHTLLELVVGEIKSCQLFLRILPLCNNLQSLQVDRFWATRNHGNLSSASPSLPITCDHLERLSLSLTHWERLSTLFTSINLPAVTEIELRLSYEFDKSAWPSLDFIEMLRRSQYLFRISPELEDFEFEEVSWMTCFTLHLLSSLTLPGEGLEEEDDRQDSPLLPKLSRLSVRWMKAWDQPDVVEMGVAMLESRRDENRLQRYQCARLDEVSLSLYPEDTVAGPTDPLDIQLGGEELRQLGTGQRRGPRTRLTKRTSK
ncbi:hypothetical protein PQX77_011724 [Marasmius sp. AFHP31]|nr:hypothetical protein PQX77_011724 [Marasmius sp. AFHP31]